MDIEVLKRLANGATPGPWEVVYPEADEPQYFTVKHVLEESGTVADCYNYSDAQDKANAEFIAAFNPQVCKELIDQLSTQSARIAELEKELSVANDNIVDLHDDFCNAQDLFDQF